MAIQCKNLRIKRWNNFVTRNRKDASYRNYPCTMYSKTFIPAVAFSSVYQNLYFQCLDLLWYFLCKTFSMTYYDWNMQSFISFLFKDWKKVEIAYKFMTDSYLECNGLLKIANQYLLRTISELRIIRTKFSK